MSESLDPTGYGEEASESGAGADGLPIPGGPGGMPPRPPLPPEKTSKLGITGLIVGIAGILAAVVMAAMLVTAKPAANTAPPVTAPAYDYGATAEGFMIEPADSIGPDAFTVSVVADDDQTCDKKKFLEELNADTDAKREWARVLGIVESEIEAFVNSLQSKVLTSDTKVTNHGLHNGKAYARPSMLTAGTVVLTAIPDAEGNYTVPPESPRQPESPTPTGTSGTGGQPVTRCKCGNPLLPPYQPSSEVTPTATATSSPSPTTSPRSQQRTSPRSTRTPTPTKTSSTSSPSPQPTQT